MTTTLNNHSAIEFNARRYEEIAGLTNRLPTLGWSVMWWMGGLQVPHALLAQAMQDYNLGDFTPKAPSPRVALHRALEAMIRAGSLPDEDEFSPAPAPNENNKPLVRTVNDYAREWLVFALVDEHQNLGTLSLRYGTRARIKLHKKTGAMVCVTSAEGDIEAENESQVLANCLAPYWSQYQDLHTSRDLSVVLKSVIDWHAAVAIRKEGGVYFVPQKHADVLDRVRGMLTRLAAACGGEPILLQLGVPDEDETRRSMAKAAYLGLCKEADEWLAEAASTLNSEAKVRDNTFSTRIQEYHHLKLKLEAYDEILDSRQAELGGRLKQANELVLLLCRA